jgi:alpha-tubulin suppressor-like RCC1 family protein
MPSRLAVLPALVAMCLLGLIFSAGAQASGGTAYGWGENESGQTGNGTPGPDVLTPAPVVGLSDVTQVAGGEDHGLALLSDGTVRAWGGNASGQLGNGTTTDSPTPVAVSGLSGVVAVAAGGENSLALLANGTVVAWGDNAYGELGDGATTGPDTCGTSACSRVPVPVPGLSNVVAISASEYYNVALLSNGTVMTWGYNYYGEVGDGAGTQENCECISTPQPVPGVSGAVAISAGWYQAAALLQDGTVKDWGWNYYGDLGGGTDSSLSPPAPECNCSGPVTVSGVSGAKATTAGGYHGLALFGDGAVRSWGYNEYGQLGLGEDTGPELCGTYPCSRVSVPVPDVAATQAISAGAYHTLALASNGTVTAWGYNGEGALGNGSEEESAVPVPVSDLVGVSAIAANDYNSYAIVGASQNLNVALAGAGAGTVGGPTGILCSANCSARFPQGQVEILKAVAAPGSGFAGFSGPCAGTGTCQLAMGTDQTVTATFGPPKGTAITATTVKKQKRKKPVAKAQRRGKAKARPIAKSTATLSFAAPGAITGYECKLIKPRVKPVHKPKHHKKHGAKSSKRGKAKTPKPVFSPCSSPRVYPNLKPGSYTFEVRALDILGADATPAVVKFRAKR